MLTVLAVVVWVVCGVLAYGIVKNEDRQFYTTIYWKRYGWKDELVSLSYLFFWPTLILVFLSHCATGVWPVKEIGLTYRMPKELCAKRS